MRARTALFAAAGVAAAVAAYALSPYLSASSIDEQLPSNVALPGGDAGEIAAMEADAGTDARLQETLGAEIGMMEQDAAKDARLQETLDPEIEAMDAGLRQETQAAGVVQAWPSGRFVGAGDGIHDASGTARILPLDDGSRVLRLEDFNATNGPDLYVYLATDGSASDHVSLGRLKASAGNQNYGIPGGVDLETHDTVLVWCKAFGVLFGSAQLS